VATLDQAEHATWMRLAHREAVRALDAGEVPVGAVVVRDRQVIGTGYNQPIRAGDPTAHAEIIALRDAARTAHNYRLAGATVYVTVEPCLMCAGALVHGRIHTLVYGTREPRTGAVRSAMRVLDDPSLNHRVGVVEGLLADEARELMRRFFRARRQSSNFAVS
jgi:tRNA(adenine34) deaminase